MYKTISVSRSYANVIKKDAPDTYSNTTDPSVSANKEIVLGYAFDKEILEKQINKAEFKLNVAGFEDYDASTEIYLKLYSGSSEKITYNKLLNECVQYKWNESEKLKFIVEDYEDYLFDLSEYIDIFREIINSENEILIVVGTEKTDPEWISFDIYPAGGHDAALRFECLYPPKAKLGYPVNIEIPNSETCVFKWDYDGASNQKTYEIGWSADDGNSWNDYFAESSNHYHTFNAGQFPAGKIQWRVKVSSEADYYGEYSYASFECMAELPIVKIEFPNEIKISNLTKQIFLWTYNGKELEQSCYQIEWSADNGESWTTEIGEGTNCYHEFEAEYFPIGEIIWRIKASNTEGYFSEYVLGVFESVGKGEVPTIINVTQDAIPEISWISDHQAAYEVQIKRNDKLICSSGIIGGDAQVYRPNVMLKNDSYLIQVRILNIYGYMSEWGSLAVVLSAEEIQSSAVMSLIENEAYGVEINCGNLSGTGYVYRICADKEILIGKYSGSPIYDYSLTGNDEYTYVLRDYISGYAESQKIKFKASFTGALLHDVDEPECFVNIKLSQEDEVIVDNVLKKNTVYNSCIGRIYPIKETNGQRSETVSVTGFLNEEECRILRRKYAEDKEMILRTANYCYKADISSYKESGYLNKGYIVQVGLTRIDDSSEVKMI